MKAYLNEALYSSRRSAIREFTALAGTVPGCIKLTLGEPDFDTPEPVREAAKAALDNHETHYIPNQGIPELRRAIADFENHSYGMDFQPEEILVTVGATEALFIAFFGILNPGDEVIIPAPAFVLYEEIVKLCRAVPVLLDTSKDGFQLSRETLEQAMTPRTKAILLNSPNNPTGCVYTRESLDNVHELVKDKPVFILCDDVYRQLVYTEDYHSFMEYRDLRKQLLLIQSFSKPYAMTGWRMGYLAADREVMERLELIHQFSVVSTPAPFQKACMEALSWDPSEMRETYRKRRDYVCGRLKAMGLSYVKPQGAFYVFPSVKELGLDSAELARRLIREAKVAVTPGFCLGAEGFIRISCGASMEDLEEGLSRMERWIRNRKETMSHD